MQSVDSVGMHSLNGQLNAVTGDDVVGKYYWEFPSDFKDAAWSFRQQTNYCII